MTNLKNNGRSCDCYNCDGDGFQPNPKDIHNIHDKNIMDRFRSAAHRVREMVKCWQKEGYIEDSMNISFGICMSEKNPTTKMFRNCLLDIKSRYREKIFDELLEIFDNVFCGYIKEIDIPNPNISMTEYKKYIPTKNGEKVLAFRVRLRELCKQKKESMKENPCQRVKEYISYLLYIYRFQTPDTINFDTLRERLMSDGFNPMGHGFSKTLLNCVTKDLVEIIDSINMFGAKKDLKAYFDEIERQTFQNYCMADPDLAKLWNHDDLSNSRDKKEVEFDKTQKNQFRFLPHPDCCVFNKKNYTHSLSIKIAEDGKFKVRETLEKWREFIQKNQSPLDVYPVSIGFKDIDKAQKWIDEFSNVSFKVNFKFDDDIPKSLTIQEIARLIGTDSFLYTVSKEWLDRTDMKKALRLEFDREGTTSLITRFVDVNGEEHYASEDIEYAYTDVDKATEAFKKLQRQK